MDVNTERLAPGESRPSPSRGPSTPASASSASKSDGLQSTQRQTSPPSPLPSTPRRAETHLQGSAQEVREPPPPTPSPQRAAGLQAAVDEVAPDPRRTPIPAMALHAVFYHIDDVRASVEAFQVENNTNLVVGSSRSVQNANKRLKEGQVEYPDEIKYSWIKFECKHAGTVRKSGKGTRQHQRSFKKSCPVKIILNGYVTDGSIRVTTFEVTHENHPVSYRAFKSVPERRLGDMGLQTQCRVDTMMKTHVKASQVAAILNKEDGLRLTAKDIHNLCRNPEVSDELRFMAEIGDIYKDDPTAIIHVIFKNGMDVDWVYIQTTEMRRNYQRYPEVISADTTYKVNDKDMHLVTLMVIDNEGHGRTVAHAIVNHEKEYLMARMMSLFVEYNALECAKTEAVLVDKSFVEIKAIQAAMPLVKIHLCVWHAMRTMKGNLPKLSETRREKVIELLVNVTYAYTREMYDEALEVLYAQPDLRAFSKYFDKNWNKCDHQWAQFQRRGVPTFEARTTNYLESFHQKLKKFVSANTAIQHLVRILFDMSEEKSRREHEEELMNQLKVSYNLRHDNPVTRTMYEYCSKFSAKKSMVEYEKALARRDTMTCCLLENDVHQVNFLDKEYRVTLGADGYDCTCGFYLCNRIFCQHAWLCVLEYNYTFLRAWVKRRWYRDMNSQYLDRDSVPTDTHEKLRQVMMVLKEIGSLTSVASNEEYVNRMSIFDWLYDLFVKGGTIKLQEILQGLAAYRAEQESSTSTDSSVPPMNDADPSASGADHGDNTETGTAGAGDQPEPGMPGTGAGGPTSGFTVPGQEEANPGSTSGTPVRGQRPGHPGSAAGAPDPVRRPATPASAAGTPDPVRRPATPGSASGTPQGAHKPFTPGYTFGTPGAGDSPFTPKAFSTPGNGFGTSGNEDGGETLLPNVPSSPFIRTPSAPRFTPAQEQKEREFVRSRTGKVLFSNADGKPFPDGTPFKFRPKQVHKLQKRVSNKAPNKGWSMKDEEEKRGKNYKKATQKRPWDGDDASVFGVRPPTNDKKPPPKARKTTTGLGSKTGGEQNGRLQDTALFKFVGDQDPFELAQLYSICKRIEYKKARTISDVSRIRDNPARLLEYNLHQAGLDDLIEQCVQCVVIKLKYLLDNTVNFEERADVAHLMAIILTHSYNQGEELPTVATSVLPIPNDPAFVQAMVKWPGLSSMDPAEKYRLGDCTVTKPDFETLQNREWLGDQHIHGFLSVLQRNRNTDTPNKLKVLSCYNASMWLQDKFNWLYEKEPLEEFEWLMTPICMDGHWVLLAANTISREVVLMDSLPRLERRTTCISLWRTFWHERCVKLEMENRGWIDAHKPSGHQDDGWSCGIFVCMNAVALVCDMQPSIFQQCHVDGYAKYIACVMHREMRPYSGRACDMPLCLHETSARRHPMAQCANCDRRCHYQCAGRKRAPAKSWKCTMCS